MASEKRKAHFMLIDGYFDDAIYMLRPYLKRGDVSTLQPIAVAYAMKEMHQQAIIYADRAIASASQIGANIDLALMYLIKAYSYYQMMTLELFDEYYQLFKKNADELAFQNQIIPSDSILLSYYEHVVTHSLKV